MPEGIKSGIDKLSFQDKLGIIKESLKGYLWHSYLRWKNEIPPLFLEFVLTWKCNSNCIMCDIARTRDPREKLSLEEIEKMLSDRKFWRTLRSINFTGGEPFLRDDLIDVISIFIKNCSSLNRITIPTNGLLTETIVDKTREILDRFDIRVDITVSLDGVGDVHNRIRGVRNAFEKTLTTIKELSKLEKNPRFHLFGQATISRLNYENWPKLREFCRENNIHISPGIVAFVESFFNNTDKENMLALDKKQIISLYDQNTVREHYIRKQAETGIRYLPCNSGFGTFIINPNGDIYFCNRLEKIGNIRENPIREIWYSKKAEEIRKTIKTGKICGTCYWTCDLTDAILEHPTTLLKYGFMHILAKVGIPLHKIDR